MIRCAPGYKIMQISEVLVQCVLYFEFLLNDERAGQNTKRRGLQPINPLQFTNLMTFIVAFLSYVFEILTR
jgi:hypothetical protein